MALIDRTNLKLPVQKPIQTQPTQKVSVIPKVSLKSTPLPLAKQANPIERIGVSATVAAQMIGVSERTIWNLATAGTIHYVRVGTRCIFSVRSLEHFINGPQESATRLKNKDGQTGKK